MSFKGHREKAKWLIVILLLFAIEHAFAAYTIKKYTINSGGGKLEGGSYELNASIGQTDAINSASNNNYQLNGGFWHINNDLIFKNDFE